MAQDPVVEIFYEAMKELLLGLASTGYVVTKLDVEWFNLSSLNHQKYAIKSLSAEISQKIK